MIKINDLSFKAYQNEERGKYIFFDIYYAGMNIGEYRMSGEVKLYQEEGVFEYEDNIKEEIIMFLNEHLNIEKYNSLSKNNNGYLKYYI